MVLKFKQFKLRNQTLRFLNLINLYGSLINQHSQTWLAYPLNPCLRLCAKNYPANNPEFSIWLKKDQDVKRDIEILQIHTSHFVYSASSALFVIAQPILTGYCIDNRCLFGTNEVVCVKNDTQQLVKRLCSLHLHSFRGSRTRDNHP